MTKRIDPHINSSKIPQRDVEAIFALRDQEHTDRQIANALGIHHKTVASYRRKAGLPPNGIARRQLNVIDEHTAKCTRCGEVKSLADWPVQRRNGEIQFRLSYCRDCRRIQQNVAQNKTEYVNIRTRWGRLKARSKRFGMIFAISFDDFWAQWKSQNTKCFYTDQNLIIDFGNGRHERACSVDKVEPNLGYVFANVVFAANRINSIKYDVTLEEMKAWMPSWYERVTAWRSAGIPCAQVAEGDF